MGLLAERHAGEVGALARELLRCARQDLRLAGAGGCGGAQAAAAVLLEDEGRVVAGLLAYSRALAAAVPSKAMALAEMGWRNGSLLRCLARQRAWGAGALVPEGRRQPGAAVGTSVGQALGQWLLLDEGAAGQSRHEAWLLRAGVTREVLNTTKWWNEGV